MIQFRLGSDLLISVLVRFNIFDFKSNGSAHSQVRVMKSIRQHGFGSGSVRWLGSVDSVNSPSQPSQLSQQMGSGSTQCTSPRLSPTRFRLGVFWFDSVKLVDSASRLGQLCIST
ncbi:hypothetical protein HanXRQr2_Chr07g0286681 [Helianthus annuus]|uniref:Uncharacterized protein n=1 Tax=Helianthus annuus TaxID=4232 RepID=A0A9K3NFR7_HELAN|nr:hypothetical protein HanXRQr2_Chr07g0286681 [Helianthus annuus]KAJ0904069.1 hypothetical protein HanPSC8_Chr07g0277561 [Helianthus annuus]